MADVTGPAALQPPFNFMNEIEADATGTVVKCLCENGQAVEFGQPLFIIE